MVTVSQPQRIVAGLLFRGGRLLLGCRPAGRRQAGKWEFPGGKREPGESGPAALARELAEELRLAAPPARMRLLFRRRHWYAETGWLELAFYRVESWRGRPARVHYRRLRWVSPDRLGRYDLLAADRLALPRLLAAISRADRISRSGPANGAKARAGRVAAKDGGKTSRPAAGAR